ncbi:hypothetical protein PM030_05310 [Halorubrum ezzemoulense]|uniref:hypothetical protein n=1 Tax=Halorubrum ezzemoulense TaxID=337243 RepID=UPI00232AA545|nr:hypothetical protein [Halorubrum ezzemoulense]MDB2281287.1 hypothetical protein [Halorubrum ezzemoulense]
MGLRSVIQSSTVLDEYTYAAAEEVRSDFHTQGHVAPKYRRHLLVEYQKLEGCPPKRKGNNEWRNSKEAQLDRAWPIVAERFDRTPEDIRSCVMGIYETVDPDAVQERAEETGDDRALPEIERDTKTAQLRSDFDEILELAAEHRNS